MSLFNLFERIVNHDVITDMLWMFNDFIYSLHDRYMNMNVESSVMINDSLLSSRSILHSYLSYIYHVNYI
jgi:hypothetical protein